MPSNNEMNIISYLDKVSESDEFQEILKAHIEGEVYSSEFDADSISVEYATTLFGITVSVVVVTDGSKERLDIRITSQSVNSNDYTIEFLRKTDLLESEVRAEKLEFDIDYWSYNITYDQLARMYESDKIIIPDMQRGFVWDHLQASKLIESIFMGLPLPSIFFIKQDDGNYVVVDGLQRITTIHAFRYNVALPNNKGMDGFRLKGVNSKIEGQTWRSVIEIDSNLQDKFEMGTINVIEFKQNKPAYEEAMYVIFERLNSGGTSLSPQQIRNSISYGYFNEKLNKCASVTVSRLFSPKANEKLEPSETLLRVIAIYDLVRTTYPEPELTRLLADEDNFEKITTSTVYKSLLNKTADHYHIEYKKAERLYILGLDSSKEFSKEEFLNSTVGKEYSQKVDALFERIAEIDKYVVGILGKNTYKRVEDGEYKARGTQLFVESTIAAFLLFDKSCKRITDSAKVESNYKEYVEKYNEQYFNQGTSRIRAILGRIMTMKKVFFENA